MLNYFQGDSTIQREVSNVAEMDYVRILRDLREDADKTQTQIAEVLGTLRPCTRGTNAVQTNCPSTI